MDEIWSFVGCKKKNVKPEHNEDWGDAWTFVAIDADTKLVPRWFVGQRTAEDACDVLTDLRSGWPAGCSYPPTATRCT